MDKVPTLDLHGADRDYAKFLTNEFISDYYKIGVEKVVIIHGKGSGIVRGTVFDVLRSSKIVDKFYLNMFNDGETVVILKRKG